MNPFNTEKLTTAQLDKDCLCYMSITRHPVKSSRIFLGYLHEVAVKKMCDHFNKPEDYYKKVKANKKLLTLLKTNYIDKNVFFQNEPFSRELKVTIDFYEFKTFEESYHQLMNELCNLVVEAINLILPVNDETSNIYITGGFAKNRIFVNLIAEAYTSKMVYTSEIDNSSALGAAIVVSGLKPSIKLGLTKCEV
jgi:sugar (pentulose or hexulose) kinase